MWIAANRRKIFITGLAVLILSLHAATLLRYPSIHVDEGWLISRAWAFIQTGHQFGPLDSGVIDSIPNHWILNQWLITALQSIFLRSSPIPALLPVRIMSLLLGFGLLACNYVIGQKLGGQMLACVSSLLLALSQAFFYTAHMARYDILAVFFCYAALVVVIWDSRGIFWTGLLAGIIMGLAVETHLNSLIFIPTIGFVYLFEFGWGFMRKPAAWGFAAGLALGAFYFLVLHVFPNADIYLKYNGLVLGSTYTPPLLTLNWMKIAEGFAQSGMLILVAAFSLVPLGLIRIYSIIKNRPKNEIVILTINVTLFMGMALIMPKKSAQYAIYIAPAFLWLTALFLIDFVRRPWLQNIWNYLYMALVWGMLLGMLLSTLLILFPDNYQKYQDAQTRINTYIHKDDTIMANQWYWPALYDHKYYSWELLFLYPRMNSGKTLTDAFNHFRPTVLIIDQPLDDLIVDNVAPDSFWYNYHLSRKDMESYLSQHAVLSATIPSDLFGTIKIYRFTWD
jgi:hypothetical protein